MSRAVAFVHASMAVRNICEGSQLLDAVIGGKPVLNHLIDTLSTCKNLDDIYVVTSDMECDALVCGLMQSNTVFDEDTPKLKVLRIPSDTPYSVKESNSAIDHLLMYRQPLWGLLSVEGFLHYAGEILFDVAVVIDATSTPFVSRDAVEHFLEQGKGDGEMIYSGNPPTGIVALSPSRASELYRRKQSQVRNKKADNKSKAEREVEYIRRHMKGADNSYIENLLNRKLQSINRTELTPLDSLIRLKNSEEGSARNPDWFNGKEDILFSIKRPSDVEYVNKLIGFHDSSDYVEVYRKRDELLNEPVNTSPAYLNIEITNECNHSCDYCPNVFHERPAGRMDWDLYRRIIDEVAETVSLVSISGYGEPTLHPDLIDFIRYAKQNGVLRIAVETNGKILNGDIVRCMYEAGLDFLILNINVLTGASANWVERIEEYTRIRDTFRGENEIFPQLMLQAVNTNAMSSRMDYVWSRFNNIVDRIVILPFDTFRDAIIYDGAIDFTPLKRSACRKLRSSLCVYCDGTVSLCGRYLNDEYPDSNLKDRTVESVLCDKSVTLFINSHSSGNYPEGCLKCRQWYLPDIPAESVLSRQAYIVSSTRQRIQQFDEETLRKADTFIKTGNYSEGLNSIEQVLRHDCGNPEAIKRLRQMVNDVTADMEYQRTLR